MEGFNMEGEHFGGVVGITEPIKLCHGIKLYIYNNEYYGHAWNNAELLQTTTHQQTGRLRRNGQIFGHTLQSTKSCIMIQLMM